MRAKKSAEEIEEAKLLGKALAALRVSPGMTQRQVAELAGLNPQRICKAERGQFYPRHGNLKRILAGMGVTFAAVHRAQELVVDPMGEGAEPIDAPDFTPEEAHQAAVRLAQEARAPVAPPSRTRPTAASSPHAGAWPPEPPQPQPNKKMSSAARRRSLPTSSRSGLGFSDRDGAAKPAAAIALASAAWIAASGRPAMRWRTRISRTMDSLIALVIAFSIVGSGWPAMRWRTRLSRTTRSILGGAGGMATIARSLAPLTAT
jgi:transcriptional regulator with XRE-family HTH domain